MISPQTLLQNRYLVLEQIGRGGMGAVYKATDRRFSSTVALKETFFEDPALRKAFEREAHLLHHLRHTALPRVSDYFAEGEGLFLVMEFIPGQDLSDMLKERAGAFPAPEVLSWADQLLDALDYLHTQETPVVHRDIKPQNLKLTGRNQIILLDFGLAKGSASQQTRATATGSVLGYSLNYAPLEQMQGVGTDPRSDLYSLGATLYHLLTGEVPPDAISRANAVLNGQPDPLRPAGEAHAQVTPAVAAVLSSALALNAGQRPQSAAEMRKALRAASSEQAGTHAPATFTGAGDQETEIVTRHGRRASLNTAAARGATGTQHAATVITPAGAPGGAPSRAHRPARAVQDSTLTRVRAEQPAEAPPASKGRALGIAAGVLVFAVLAAAVYSFTRNAPAEASATPQPLKPAAQVNDQPAAQAGDQAAAPPASQGGPATATEETGAGEAESPKSADLAPTGQAAPGGPSTQPAPSQAVEPARQSGQQEASPQSAPDMSDPTLQRRYTAEELESIHAAREAEELKRRREQQEEEERRRAQEEERRRLQQQEEERRRMQQLEEERRRLQQQQPPWPPPPHHGPPPPGHRPPPRP